MFYKRFEERFALEKDADGSGAQLPGREAVRQLFAVIAAAQTPRRSRLAEPYQVRPKPRIVAGQPRIHTEKDGATGQTKNPTSPPKEKTREEGGDVSFPQA